MVINMKEFIKDCNQKIRKEYVKINNMKKQINDYEVVIDIVSKTDKSETIEIYKEKIEKCWNKINCYLDNIKHHENTIATMRKIDQVLAKGVKKSA